MACGPKRECSPSRAAPTRQPQEQRAFPPRVCWLVCLLVSVWVFCRQVGRQQSHLREQLPSSRQRSSVHPSLISAAGVYHPLGLRGQLLRGDSQLLPKGFRWQPIHLRRPCVPRQACLQPTFFSYQPSRFPHPMEESAPSPSFTDKPSFGRSSRLLLAPKAPTAYGASR